MKKPKRKPSYLLRKLHQVGKSNLLVDSMKDAKLPGKRTTAWKTTYWETRKNRSDEVGKKV